MAKSEVVILNWNGAVFLQRFLPSVLASLPEGVGVTVADNGSTDSSLDVLRNLFPQVSVIPFGENLGYAAGYDRALDKIDADIAVLLNSDVQTPQGWLEPLLLAMEADPSCAAASPKILSLERPGYFEYAGAAGGFIDMLGYPFCRGRVLGTIERDMEQYDSTCDVFWASGACMALRLDAFRRVGGFDPGFFAHMEEIDLCWRLQLAGYRILSVTQSCVYHLGGGTLPNNSPQKLYLNFRNNLAMLYRNLPAARRLWTLPLRSLMDLGSAFVYVLLGRREFASAVLRAHRDFSKRRPGLRAARKAMEAFMAGSLRLPETMMRGSMLVRYLFGRRTFDRLSF